MSAKNIVNFEGFNPKKIMQGASLTIPDAIDTDSPTQYSGISPVTLWNAKRNVAGGVILWGFSDAAGNAVFTFNEPLNPGDVVAMSAVISNVVTITVTDRNGNARTIGTITGVTTNAILFVGYA